MMNRLLTAIAMTVFLASTAHAQTQSFIRYVNSASPSWSCPWPSAESESDDSASFTTYGSMTIQHVISCPGGTEVILGDVWVPYQYSSACYAVDANGWPYPPCDGSVNGFTEDLDTQWRANIHITSKRRNYSFSEWVCTTENNYEYGYTFDKKTSDQVEQCNP